MDALALLLALLYLFTGSVYRVEDFHYYEANGQSRGLPLVNKVYVEVFEVDKEDFLSTLSNLKIERFKEFDNGELRGYLVFPRDKEETLYVLNTLNKRFRAFPVVIFDGIECTTNGSIVVGVRPSVNINDYKKRLYSIADGKFKVTQLRQKLYKISVDELKNPSNIIILSNLLAKDSVWVDNALVAWIPLDGYVKAEMNVETPSVGQLGELRTLKLTIDVFSSDAKVRTDLLPQLGQGFLPFPFSGEIWFDAAPPKITTVGKKIIVEYKFRQLQFGSFMFQPIVISYERNGELKTIKSNSCQYIIRSVIADTDINDIQDRPTDKLDLAVIQPVGFQNKGKSDELFWYAKVGVSSLCFGFAAILIISVLLSLMQSVVQWFKKDESNALWRAMVKCDGEDRSYYEATAKHVNNVLASLGTSLYGVKLSECTDNFRNLVNELDRLYQPNPFWHNDKLKGFVGQFYKDRRYK